MALKTLLYYLFSANRKPQYVTASGAVLEGNDNYTKPDGTLANLQTDPGGHRETTIKFARNIKYWGVFRDITTPMLFSNDGAHILKQHMWFDGIEALCYIGIMRLERTTLPYGYKPWYISEINFAKYKELYYGVQIEALEGGPSKYLKANESTQYRIPIEANPDYISTTFDGMELDNTAQFFIGDGTSTNPAFEQGNHVVDLSIINKEVEDIGGVQDVPRTQLPGDNAGLLAANVNFFEATATGTIALDWNYTILINLLTSTPAVNPANLIRTVIRVVHADGTSTTQLQIFLRNNSTGFTGTFNVVGNGTLAVVPGDKVFMLTFCSVIGSDGDQLFEFIYSGNEPVLNIVYTFRPATSIVSGLTPYTLAQALVSNMTEGKYTLKSNYLAAMEDIMITSGDALRAIRAAFIQTSFEEFRQSMLTRAIGVGIEGDQIVIEHISYFFQNTVIADIGELKDAEVTIADDIIGNVIKTGYEAKEYDKINGRTEINQGQVWSTPITKIIADINLVSKYRADPLGAELMRQNFSDKKTTDTDSDNDTWLINIKPQFNAFSTLLTFDATFTSILVHNNFANINEFAQWSRFKITGTNFNDGTYTVTNIQDANPDFYIFPATLVRDEADVPATIRNLNYVLNRPAYTATTGITHPASIYNLEFRPKNTILNNGALLHSLFDRMDGKSFLLQSYDKYVDFGTTINGITINEHDPIQIGSLPAKYFQPYYITGKAQLPINMLALMATNPYGKVRFTWRGRTYYGFLVDGSVNAEVQETQEWKMLSAPENDHTKFNPSI